MQITLNGESHELVEGATVSDLLQQRHLDARYLAAEVNREVVPRAKHAQHVLRPGDIVEIVTLVGGG